MKIKRIINNNFLIVVDNGIEKILNGRGISFGKKVNDEVNEALIEKSFMVSADYDLIKFTEIINSTSPEIIDIISQVITLAKVNIGKEISDSIFISLADHISYAISRSKKGKEVRNAFIWDIKKFYKDEYSVGLKAVALINDKFKTKLNEDEAGFIALHIVNSEMFEHSNDIYEVTSIIRDITKIITMYFMKSFKEDSLSYYRLITHLKFLAKRIIINKAKDENSENDELLKLIILNYPDAYACSKKIYSYVLSHYDYKISSDELAYLTIHIQRSLFNDN